MNTNKFHTPIFVTGIERSGISIVSQILQICGAWTGEITDRWENKQLKQLLNKYYNSIGLDPKGQNPIPDTSKLLIPNSWVQDVENCIFSEGYKHTQTWLFKSARLCQTWPIWNYAFPSARWIIVRRRTGDIVQSCMKTDFMKAYDTEEGWKDWVHKHEKYFVEMIEGGVNCKIVWPERMVHGDYHQMYEAMDWVGLPWNTKVLSVVDPLLWNSRKKEGK